MVELRHEDHGLRVYEWLLGKTFSFVCGNVAEKEVIVCVRAGQEDWPSHG